MWKSTLWLFLRAASTRARLQRCSQRQMDALNVYSQNKAFFFKLVFFKSDSGDKLNPQTTDHDHGSAAPLTPDQGAAAAAAELQKVGTGETLER